MCSDLEMIGCQPWLTGRLSLVDRSINLSWQAGWPRL